MILCVYVCKRVAFVFCVVCVVVDLHRPMDPCILLSHCCATCFFFVYFGKPGEGESSRNLLCQVNSEVSERMGALEVGERLN